MRGAGIARPAATSAARTRSRASETALSGRPATLKAGKIGASCSFFFQAEDGIRDYKVTGVQTCALPILKGEGPNHLRRAAEHLVPSLKEFGASLGPGWQMTGSGSAFYKRINNEGEGRQADRKSVV